MSFIDKDLFEEAEILNEALFKSKKEYVIPSKEDYNKAYNIAKKILYKNPLIKKSCKFKSYKIDEENPYEIEICEFDYTIRNLPSMEGDEWHEFIQVIVPDAEKELSDELEKYNMELSVVGIKFGWMFIKKYQYPTKKGFKIKESYEERRELNMSFIDKELFDEAELKEGAAKDYMKKNGRDVNKYAYSTSGGEKGLKDHKEENRQLKEKFNKDHQGPKANYIHKVINKNAEVAEKRKNVKTENMSMAQQYDYIIKEFYDIADADTRKILVSVSEADKNQVLSSLTNKLYNDIVDKVDDIDFGTIPMSKGDITKIDNYDRLIECIRTIENIMKEYHQDTKNNIDVITAALENLITRKELFMKAFQMNLELPIVLYSTIALSIVSSVSFMISSCIEFVKSPNKDSFDVEIDKVALNKTKDNVLFDNLKKFNESCRKGQVDKSIDFIIKNRVKNFTGAEIGFVVSGIALIGIILNIVPILRELIFFFYYSRVKISDYFEIQADLLQMNAYNVESNVALDKEDKKKITKKQMKIVDTFRKIANVIGIDNKSSEVKATKEIAKASKEKYKYSDLNDSLPDSVASEIF